MILSPPYLTCFSRRNTIAGQSDEHSMYLNLQNEFCATIQITQLIPIRPTPRALRCRSASAEGPGFNNIPNSVPNPGFLRGL